MVSKHAFSPEEKIFPKVLKIFKQDKLLPGLVINEITPLFNFEKLDTLRRKRMMEKIELERERYGKIREFSEEEFKPKKKLFVLVVEDSGEITKKTILGLSPKKRKKIKIDYISSSQQMIESFRKKVPKTLCSKFFHTAWENFAKYSREKYDFILIPHSFYNLSLYNPYILLSIKKLLNEGGKAMIILFSEKNFILQLEKEFLQDVHPFRENRKSFESLETALRSAKIFIKKKILKNRIDLKKISKKEKQYILEWLFATPIKDLKPLLSHIDAFLDEISRKQKRKKMLNFDTGILLIEN